MQCWAAPRRGCKAGGCVMIDTVGFSFNTVMSPLKSDNNRWGIKTVTLVIRRVEGGAEAGAAAAAAAAAAQE
jgi:hypothetical protein